MIDSKSSTLANVVIVAQYFGTLPPYFRAWLETCRSNKKFSWFFATDQPLDNYDIPPNVMVAYMTLAETSQIFSRGLHTEVCLTRPYKLCDFRPFLWILLDHFSIQYSHWGHCDIDMIFGNLDAFITVDMLKRAERVFKDGHFAIYRNSRLAKSMAFSSRGMLVDWKTVVTTDRSFGFDEHHGVNRAWSKFPELWACEDSAIYDVEPQVEHLAPSRGAIFPRVTSIGWKGGVLTVSETNTFGITANREVMAVHFQKRPIRIEPNFDLADGFLLLPNAIAPLIANRVGREWVGAQRNVKDGFSLRDRLFLARNWLRKSKFYGTIRRFGEPRL